MITLFIDAILTSRTKRDGGGVRIGVNNISLGHKVSQSCDAEDLWITLKRQKSPSDLRCLHLT